MYENLETKTIKRPPKHEVSEINKILVIAKLPKPGPSSQVTIIIGNKRYYNNKGCT